MTVYGHIIAVVKSLAFKESRYVENYWEKEKKHQVEPVDNIVANFIK